MSDPNHITQRVMYVAPSLYKPLGAYPGYVKALLNVKKACAQANTRAKALDPLVSENIQTACHNLSNAPNLSEIFSVDVLFGGGQLAINMNINEAIATEVLQKFNVHLSPKTQINASQSTADVCHTASRIALILQHHKLDETLVKITDIFHQKQNLFAPITTRARTCLQDAMPVSLGSLWEGYAHALERCTQSLRDRSHDLTQINLGGTVIGSRDGAPPKYLEYILEELTNVTGLPLVWRKSLYDAAQNADDLGRIASEVSLLARSLIKIAKDLRLLASGPKTGFNELKLSKVMNGSSFFKEKVNPILEETVIQVAMQVIGLCEGALSVLDHAELNLNVFEGLLVFNLLDSFDMLSKALEAWAEHSLLRLSANEAVCKSHSQEN